jgi:hypothetical protein
MTFRELKNSTLYQSSDLDDFEVYISIAREGKRQLEQLSFTGFTTIGDVSILVIGGLTDAVRMIESGEMVKPDDYDDGGDDKQLYLEFE